MAYILLISIRGRGRWDMGAAAKPFLNIVIRALFQMGARPHKELAGMALSQTLGSNPYLSDSDRNEWLLMLVKSSETLNQLQIL